jgi:ribosomal protein L35
MNAWWHGLRTMTIATTTTRTLSSCGSLSLSSILVASRIQRATASTVTVTVTHRGPSPPPLWNRWFSVWLRQQQPPSTQLHSMTNSNSAVLNLNCRYKHTFKTNKSIAKRFRVRGNGDLKRSKSGFQHNTGYRSRQSINKLGQSAPIQNPKVERKMKTCMGLR